MINHYAILKWYNDKNGCVDICFYDCTVKSSVTYTEQFLGKNKKVLHPFRFKAQFCGVFPFNILREERPEKLRDLPWKRISCCSLVPRPVCAIRVTRGGLEPSAIARIFPTSLTGDVTSELAEGNWEWGCCCCCLWIDCSPHVRDCSLFMPKRGPVFRGGGGGGKIFKIN